MDTPEPDRPTQVESLSFVANGRKPKGEYKTWKTPKSEKPTESYKERREKRIAAHQAAVASKSKLRENGERWVDAHQHFTTGEEAIVDEESINTATTWEDISYDAIREAVARQFLVADQSMVDPDTREQYRIDTAANWDAFYGQNKQNFFKDRNYLGQLLKDLGANLAVNAVDTAAQAAPSRPLVMEVGSGVGNSLFPLMNEYPSFYFLAFDCSSNAITLLKQHEQYSEANVHAFVCDITREAVPDEHVKDGTVDIATMIFMLSAVAPEQMDDVLQRINRKLKVGGTVLFRDYGVYDMTQMRFFAKKTTNKLGENFYRRSDGTFTYFFSLEVLADLFQRNGFSVIENTFDTRVLSNRKRKIRMYRVWAQSKFVKVAEVPATSSSSLS